MEGDSLLTAVMFFALGASCLIDPAEGRFRRTEIALGLLCIACATLLLTGYDPRIGWSLMVETSSVAAAFAAIFALVRWGRKELAEVNMIERST